MQLLSRSVCWLLSIAILTVSLLVLLCRENESYASPESAVELYAKGLTLYAKEQYSKASIAFESSYSSAPKQETLFAWAQSERLQGHCDKASELFESYIGNAPDAKQTKVAFRLIRECKLTDKVEKKPEASPNEKQNGTSALQKQEASLSNHATDADMPDPVIQRNGPGWLDNNLRFISGFPS